MEKFAKFGIMDVTTYCKNVFGDSLVRWSHGYSFLIVMTQE